MTMSHLYEDFGAKKPRKQSSEHAPGPEREEDVLASFEDGYQAGWDDAIKAEKSTRAAVINEFADSLSEMAFSYHDARSALAHGMETFLQPVLAEIIPLIARSSLPGLVVEKLKELIQVSTERPIEIVVSPDRMVAFREAFEESLTEPFVIVPDESLEPDKVFVRLGDIERSFELDNWLDEIRDIIDTHLRNCKKDPSRV